MADTPTTTAATAPATPAPDVPVTPDEAVGGVQLTRHSADRVGSRAIGVEYGNPYDPDTPPYSVYRDPMREVLEQREAADEAEAQLKSKARGTEYRFDGHTSPYEWTEELRTRNGSARIGEMIVLAKDDHDSLTRSGFLFTKVEKAEKDKS